MSKQYYHPFQWDIDTQSGDVISIISTFLNAEKLEGLVSLENTADLTYTLMVNGKEKGVINIPKDQFLKDVIYDESKLSLIFTFNTTDGEKVVPVVLPEFISKEYIDNLANEINKRIDTLTNDVINVNNKVDVNANTIADINKKADTNANTIDTINKRLEENINTTATINKKADENSKSIVTVNGKVDANMQSINVINGKIEEHNQSIATVNDKVDANTNTINIINTQVDNNKNSIVEINTKIEEHNQSIATVNGKVDTNVQSINTLNGRVDSNVELIDNVENKSKEHTSHIDLLNSEISVYDEKLRILQAQLDALTLEKYENVQEFNGSQILNTPDKNYLLENKTIDNKLTEALVGKSFMFKNSILTNNVRLTINAENITFDGMNINGDFPQKDGGNATIMINDAKTVVFKNMTFDSNNIYNGIEIGLNSSVLPSTVLFDNCKFTGNWSNNAILVFATTNNAIITVNNCYFQKVSNPLRLSNKTNATGVVLNVVNCRVDEWEANKEYTGLLLLQDYNKYEGETAEAKEAAIKAANVFGKDKITIKVTNLYVGGKKFEYNVPAEICGSKNEKQLVYLYADSVKKCFNFEEKIFPTIIVK